MVSRLTGTVKFFNPAKGYGFLVPDAAERDVFFHEAEVVSEIPLIAGQAVTYLIGTARDGRTIARGVMPSGERQGR
jgi:cold shock protein